MLSSTFGLVASVLVDLESRNAAIGPGRQYQTVGGKKKGEDSERKRGPQQRYGTAWLCGILPDGEPVEKKPAAATTHPHRMQLDI